LDKFRKKIILKYDRLNTIIKQELYKKELTPQRLSR